MPHDRPRVVPNRTGAGPIRHHCGNIGTVGQCRRMCSTTSGWSRRSMEAMTFISEPQFGQHRGSTSYTRFTRAAQRILHSLRISLLQSEPETDESGWR